MKKVLSMVVVLVVLLTSFAMLSVNAANATTGLITQYVNEKANSVEVTIKLKGATQTISNITLYVNYDKDKLTLNTDTATQTISNRVSGWTTKVPPTIYSTFDSKKAVKISYATTTPAVDGFSLADGVEETFFKFELTKLTPGAAIGATCPTSWGSVKTSVTAYAYSVISTVGALGDYSTQSTKTPTLFTIGYTEYVVPVTTHTVTFKADGATVDTKTVNDGATLTDIPTVPAKSGFTAAWDRTDFTNITSDLTVTAVYTPIVVDNIITASITGNGKVRINDGFVLNGGQVNLGTGTSAKIAVVPAFGYEVASATFGGVSMGLDKDGGVYTATVSGTKALVVTFAARTEVVKPQILHEVFKEIGKTKNRQGEFNKEVTTFAKKPATATEYGVELKNSLGEGVTIPSGEGPKFKATAGTSATGQYGINFIGLPSGTYTATPYAIVEGVTYYGTAVTFVAE